MLSEKLREQLSNLDNSIVINSLNVWQDSVTKVWTISAILTVDPSNPLSEKDRAFLERYLSELVEVRVYLSFDLIPRVKLRSQQDNNFDHLQKEVSSLLANKFPDSELISFTTGKDATSSATPSAIFTAQIRMAKDRYPITTILATIREKISQYSSNAFKLKLKIIPVEEVSDD